MIKRFIDKLLSLSTCLYHRSYYKRFISIGKKVYIGKGVKIDFPECVSIGNEVIINDYSWITMVKYNYQKDQPVKVHAPILKIGDGTYIGRFNMISCINRIEIGKKVMFADRCYLGDTAHGYLDPTMAIIDQYLTSPGPIHICDGSWIGINATILPNVSIGRNCVIGANSVVTKDIPDYSIAMGVPAKIITRINYGE